MAKYNILSLFDGISGGRIALERAFIDVDKYYASEVDKYAIEVTNRNYPDTIQLGDITKISYKEGILYTENGDFNVGTIDILLGGSPCQSFTFAGKREGMKTESKIDILTLKDYLNYKKKGFKFSGQSYLFWEYMRLLKEINPKYFLLENVKMESKWKDVISEAIGIEPININSNLLSAQNRDRLYWTNINNGKIPLPKDKGLKLKDILIKSMDDKYPLSKTHYDAFMKSYPNWKHCPIDGKAKPLLATYYKQPPHCPYIKSKKSESGYRRLSPLECERLQTLPENYTLGLSDTQRYKTIGNGWTVDVISYILSFINNYKSYEILKEEFEDSFSFENLKELQDIIKTLLEENELDINIYDEKVNYKDLRYKILDNLLNREKF